MQDDKSEIKETNDDKRILKGIIKMPFYDYINLLLGSSDKFDCFYYTL